MKNAIIVAAKRTGSTFLQEVLNSHPNITCYDEMFMRYNKNKKRRGQFLYYYMKTEGYSVKQYINWLFSNNGSILFRLMYPHAEKNKNIIECIQNQNIPVIHLIRKNKISHYISSETKKQNKIKVDISKMKKKMEEAERKNDKYKKIFKDNDYIEIFYEDMFGKVEGDKDEVKQYGAFNIRSTQKTFLSEKYTKKICDFLNVQYKEMFCNITKRNHWDIWKHVKNGDEIKKNLKNTKWKDFL